MTKPLKYTLIVTVTLSILILGTLYSLSDQVLDPESSMELTQQRIIDKWGSNYETEMSHLPAPIEISIPSPAGYQLHGQYFAASDTADCAIILCHGWTSNWAGMLRYAQAVQPCGCDMLLYDHRAHGQSGGTYPTGGIRESEDLIAVTHWLQHNKNYELDQIAWLGASWGAATALQAGAADTDVAFIIADSPFEDWYAAISERAVEQYGDAAHTLLRAVMQIVNWRSGIDYHDASALSAADDIDEPVLLIHSAGDQETHSAQSIHIAERLNDRSVFHHTQWGNDHTADVRNNMVDYQALISDFITELDNPHFSMD